MRIINYNFINDEEFVDLVVECVRDCDFIPIQVERL